MIDNHVAAFAGSEHIPHDAGQHGTNYTIRTQNKTGDRFSVEPGLRLAVSCELEGIRLN